MFVFVSSQVKKGEQKKTNTKRAKIVTDKPTVNQKLKVNQTHFLCMLARLYDEE